MLIAVRNSHNLGALLVRKRKRLTVTVLGGRGMTGASKQIATYSKRLSLNHQLLCLVRYLLRLINVLKRALELAAHSVGVRENRQMERLHGHEASTAT
jgi:hypothetical protein